MATPKTQLPKTETAKQVQKRKKDTRPPEQIFASRFDNEARLLLRRFAALRALGNAKRAKPTPEQVDRAEAWLRDQFEETMKDMAAKLRAPSNLKEQARNQGFKLLQG